MNIISKIKEWICGPSCKCDKKYTDKDLMRFGNYLLSDERRALYRGLKNHSLPFKERVAQVNHADLENFKNL